MQFDCKVVSVNKLTSRVFGTIQPLCSKCKNKSCTNPIVDKKISLMGIVYTARLYQLGERFYIVSHCDGYMRENEDAV